MACCVCLLDIMFVIIFAVFAVAEVVCACRNENFPHRELCSTCVSTGSDMMGWCENRLQGVIPVTLL